jgi:ubiquinone/menaquinone biosynthesis C-methylase UbiE
MKWHFPEDESERKKWQNPGNILPSIGLKRGSTFIDIGCGEGFFTIPAARIVGKSGVAYGLDVDQESIQTLKEKAKHEELDNLVLVVGDAERTMLCESCADIVFFANVLHDFNDPLKVLRNSKKMLKQKGLLADLDWKKKATEYGPPVNIRFNEEQAKELIEKGGFRIEATKEAGPFHYIITAKHRLSSKT